MFMETSDYMLVKSLVPEIRIINETEFRLIGYTKEHALLYHEWHAHSEEIDDEIFKSHSLELFQVLEKLRPTYFLVNDKKRKLSISTEINEFLVVNFQPIYSHPTMKKVALVSNELLSIQGQAESTMEDIDKAAKSKGAEFNFFVDVTQAMQWLGITNK